MRDLLDLPLPDRLAALIEPRKPQPVPGSPYCVGDLLEIEADGEWTEVRVYSVERDTDARFGCRWRMLVDPTTRLFGPFLVVHVDDDGRNYTITRRVRPSERVEG